MTTVIFNVWFVKWDLELKRKIVLLADNCTEHTNSSLLKNIKMIFLHANTTSLIQPWDQGITMAFKAHYRREIRAGIIAELDDIQDQSDARAVEKLFPSWCTAIGSNVMEARLTEDYWKLFQKRWIL